MFTLTDDGLTQENLNDIHHLSEILETGRVKHDFGRMSWTLRGPGEPGAGPGTITAMIACHYRDEIITLDANASEMQMTLLGANISIGHTGLRFSGAWHQNALLL